MTVVETTTRFFLYLMLTLNAGGREGDQGSGGGGEVIYNRCYEAAVRVIPSFTVLALRMGLNIR
jgi:hypothetical protein